jgi:hypothetical protein
MFTGEGVFMSKKKDGGIACQKWASSAQRLVHRRTIRWQTGPVRQSRRTAVLNRLSAGHRTPGELSGFARPTAGPSDTEAGVAKLTAGMLLGLSPTAGFPPTYKYPFVQLG